MTRVTNIILTLSLFLVPVICQAGGCKVIQQFCKEGAAERDIEEFRVYRDCWKYENIYQCSDYTANNCQKLREDGCEQVSSECSKQEKGWCVGHNKTFKCEKQEHYKRKETRYKLPEFKAVGNENRKHIKCQDKLECIDGKCFNQNYQANNELGQAVAMLQGLKEMEKKYSTEPVTIFKGEGDYCKKKAYGFNNCCKTGKAWVERMHLSECKAEERALMDKKSRGLCTYVGSYSKKRLGVREYTKHSYCCFQSQLVRIIQEGGRRQLGRGFGTARNPECGGITVDELQRIDFKELDFSELFRGIFNAAKLPEVAAIKQTLEGEIQTIKDSLQKESESKIKGQNPKYNREGVL